MSELELPPWAVDLRNRYLAGEASIFLLHGNVRDLQLWNESGRPNTWLDLRRFLEGFLGRTRDVVGYYNLSQGLQFSQTDHEKRFQRAINARRALAGRDPLSALPRMPASAIPVIEELITDNTQTSGVVIDFFEMICSQSDVGTMSDVDRANIVALQRWASDPAFLTTDNLVILVAEHLSDVARRVVASPQLTAINIPFPEADVRRSFLEDPEFAEAKFTMSKEALVKVTAGLSLTQIRAILRGAIQTATPITFRMVSRRKKAIIEQECHGLVEFVDPGHDFSHVGGMEGVKKKLMQVADAVKSGETTRVPMGMIFVGPMGTGKTFVAEAFAAESGLTCLKFKNFREKWVGSTEGNLEKILDLVDALGYVLLIIDEADRSLSSNDSDGGTSSRVIARLKEYMSDTDHRGRVVILMMTNRPDKLDTDLKRPGRFDFKIPFFFPEVPSERQKILEALTRKNKVTLAEGVTWDVAVENTEGYSSAELEAVLLAAVNRAADAESDVVLQEHLDIAAKDVIPSRDTRMLNYMEYLAVFEASSKEMLPERYQEISTDEVHAKLDQLRMQLGSRLR